MLCRKYGCIFVHVPKVAGQSIEHVFVDLCGLTWNTRASLLLRPNDDPSRGPPRLAHLLASEYVSCGYVSRKEFDSLFKFAFVRNPWDRAVSAYRFRGHDRSYDFKTFLFKHFPRPGWTGEWRHALPQYDYLFDEHGTLLVDFVGRFERLHEDFAFVMNRLDMGGKTLPHVNRTSSGIHYSRYYDSESRDFVAEFYRRDIASFGYVFESPPG